MSANWQDLSLPVPVIHELRARKRERPFPIQARIIPAADAGRDVLGKAPTGSGKTLAFGLSIITRLTRRASHPHRPRALVLAPTRELAIQIADEVDPYCAAAGLRCIAVFGGVPVDRQKRALMRAPDVVVATPGRAIDLLRRECLQVTDVETVVIDEADHMCGLGFLPQITELLHRTPTTSQKLLFSATLDEDVHNIVSDFLADPLIVEVSSTTPAMQQHVVVATDDIRTVAAQVAARRKPSIYFVEHKSDVDRWVAHLRDCGVPTTGLHGDMTQFSRKEAVRAFTDGDVRCLVATDIAARGIDVRNVTLVAHLDPPRHGSIDDAVKDFRHRSGRTARAGQSGTVVTFATRSDAAGIAALVSRATGRDPHVIEVEDPSTVSAALASATSARVPTGRPLALLPRGANDRVQETGAAAARRTPARAASSRNHPSRNRAVHPRRGRRRR